MPRKPAILRARAAHRRLPCRANSNIQKRADGPRLTDGSEKGDAGCGTAQPRSGYRLGTGLQVACTCVWRNRFSETYDAPIRRSAPHKAAVFLNVFEPTESYTAGTVVQTTPVPPSPYSYRPRLSMSSNSALAASCGPVVSRPGTPRLVLNCPTKTPDWCAASNVRFASSSCIS
jgi:hypothetical protein